ncbi:MAG TPA: biopolymer transporter ExbD [Candidatus Hydrogenedens sp.]|nr:biopolymer transporter ExbD [Candidatus Hydrogenedens sp.]
MREGPFGKPVKKDFPLINITSLIDVMFLLLIFLIITTTFNPHLGLSLQLPESKTNNEIKDTNIYRVIIDSKGNIFLSEKEGGNSIPVTIEELEKKLKEIKTKNPSATLILESDAEVPFRITVKVFDLALQLGYSGLTIATVPEKDRISEVGNNKFVEQ